MAFNNRGSTYFEMEKYIEMICDGYSNFCVVSSEGGLAKTWSSQAILKKKKRLEQKKTLLACSFSSFDCRIRYWFSKSGSSDCVVTADPKHL